MSPSPLCQHCGSPVPPDRGDGFCCAGCAYVHDLLIAQGLGQYYDLKGSLPVPPVAPQALRERDYEWLQQLAEEAVSQNQPAGELRLAVQGLSCIGCVWWSGSSTAMLGACAWWWTWCRERCG
ncbi:MAG TPA: heavy metal translocating P-type ATPase metal-binding domain-containing protein [Prosthecobacter sp.]|nr:heavy metal translocating P-type ATPase metal-binding domain-containing protein [Prosthecobacter sp.]